MDNLKIYNAVRAVPDGAQKAIAAGRLKGMTDISPMWRIKKFTEQFGVCGIGWKYEIVQQWTEPGASGEIAAFCNINLYVRVDGEWSEAIPGTGGSMFIAAERSGLHTSDEAYKMALTDAISVAAKALGMGADVYWDKDSTKYTKPQDANIHCDKCGGTLTGFVTQSGREMTPAQWSAESLRRYKAILCLECAKNEKHNTEQE